MKVSSMLLALLALLLTTQVWGGDPGMGARGLLTSRGFLLDKESLLSILSEQPDEDVIRSAAMLLANQGEAEAIPKLDAILLRPAISERLRNAVVRNLLQLDPKGHRALAWDRYENADDMGKTHWEFVLAVSGDPAIFEVLKARLANKAPYLRAQAIEALGYLVNSTDSQEVSQASRLLVAAGLRDSLGAVRQDAARVISELDWTDPGMRSLVREKLEAASRSEQEAGVRLTLEEALAKFDAQQPAIRK